ncbi:MAG: hypothetical protein M3O30_03865 [Planctomycetota bacterium]|nr:hypothetical protein [Planctomycetota bacterium]
MHTREVLHYSPGQLLRNRKALHRAAWLSLLVVMAMGCAIWGPAAGRWTQTMYWQHRCMTSELPPQTLVIDDSLKSPSSASAEPGMTARVNRFIGEANTNVVIFVHELHRPDGESRLVAVDVAYGHYSQPNMLDVHANVWVPGTLGKMPLFARMDWNSLHLPSDSKRVRLFAGQADPQNQTHFWFHYEVDAASYNADGWLDNNDQILIAQRP